MLDRNMAERARQQRGLLTTQDLDLLDASARQRRRRLADGVLERLHGKVVGFSSTPDTWERAALAALLALPGSVMSHGSAARLHRFDPFPTSDAVTVSAPVSAHHDLAGVDVRRSRCLPAAHITEVDGLAVTTRARTLVDLAAEISDGRLQHLIEEELGRRRTTWDELVATRATMSARGRAGLGRLRRVMAKIEGKPPTESELERRYLRLLEAAGVTAPQMQAMAPWADVEPGRVDGMYVEAKAIVELDGRAFHVRASAIERDHRRDQLALVRGYATARFTYQQITSDPRHVVEVSRHLASRHA